LANVTLTGPDPADEYEMPGDASNPSRFKFVGRGIHARRASGEVIPSANFVAVDDHWITLSLQDGRKIDLPLDWSARLPLGTPAERNTWRLLHDGVAVLWPLLGEVINVEEALAGRRPAEDPAELQKWIDARKAPSRKAG
jgi:hypothetical protein